jgi:hypothetical protein
MLPHDMALVSMSNLPPSSSLSNIGHEELICDFGNQQTGLVRASQIVGGLTDTPIVLVTAGDPSRCQRRVERDTICLPGITLTSTSLSLQSYLKARNYANYGAVPEHCNGRILPLQMRDVENRFVPVDSSLHAALGMWLVRFLHCEPAQRRRDYMTWVPKLSHPRVRYSRQRSPTWRTPVRWEYGFPYDQDAYLRIAIPTQEFLCCGGPPQTSWSSRGHE